VSARDRHELLDGPASAFFDEPGDRESGERDGEVGPYPRFLDTGWIYAADRSVAVQLVSWVFRDR
jgi:hypothetical protein